MKQTSYIKTALLLSFGGTLFAGYLSGIKFFTSTCAFNESCPYFIGYPACYFGLLMFLIMFVMSARAWLNANHSLGAIKANSVVSFLGILFAGTYTVQEISRWITNGDPGYALSLPTCAYGLVFYVIIFVLSVMAWKKSGAASTV